MAALGVPDDYDAFIVDSDTEEIIYRVPWSEITWQRVRNGVSTASVTVAEADNGPACCGLLGVLFPWSRLLRIERNGQPVWDGPVTGWGRPTSGSRGPRGVTVRAHDRSALLWKRIVAQTEKLQGDPSAILVELLSDAGFGTYVDPYTFVVPSAAETAEDIIREFSVGRIERVFDAISELTSAAGLFWTQRLTEMIVAEAATRRLLGMAGERPKLNEETTIDLPGFDVNGLEMTTVTYVGGASTGTSGFGRIGVSTLWAGDYLSATLEGGHGGSRATEQYDLDREANIAQTRTAAPKFTVEQVTLSPRFGGELLDAALHALLPGVLVDVAYEETCGFEVPFLDVVWLPQPEAPVDPLRDPVVSDSVLLPVRSDRIESVRLDQLDVNVVASPRVMETVRFSAVPYAEWDGLIPVGWYTNLRDP